MRKFDVEDFRRIVASSSSIRECLTKMGLAANGGNYLVFNRRVKRYGVDISHFNNNTTTLNKHRYIHQPRPLNAILTLNSDYNRSNLRRRLIKDGLLEYKCSICGIKEWQCGPITLQLDHINGVRNDNRLVNLRLLCPNCHSQTDTYGSKRGLPMLRKKYTGQESNLHAGFTPADGLEPSVSANSTTGAKGKCCIRCGESCHPSSKHQHCRECYDVSIRTSKAVWPDNLVELVDQNSKVHVARLLGVSDKAVAKHYNKLKRAI